MFLPDTLYNQRHKFPFVFTKFLRRFYANKVSKTTKFTTYMKIALCCTKFATFDIVENVWFMMTKNNAPFLQINTHNTHFKIKWSISNTLVDKTFREGDNNLNIIHLTCSAMKRTNCLAAGKLSRSRLPK